jgi:hypothetical protein
MPTMQTDSLRDKSFSVLWLAARFPNKIARFPNKIEGIIC